MVQRLGLLVLFMSVSLSLTHVVRTTSLQASTKENKPISRDAKFLSLPSLKSTFRELSDAAKIIPELDVKFNKPRWLEGVSGFGDSGLNTIAQGLESVAGFVGGKLGLIVGAPVGLPIGALLGGLKGAVSGSEIGAAIAKSPFKLFKASGALGGQKYGSYTTYDQSDGTKIMIAHP